MGARNEICVEEIFIPACGAVFPIDDKDIKALRRQLQGIETREWFEHCYRGAQDDVDRRS